MPPAPGVSLALRPPCFPGPSLSLSRSVRCVAHGKEISKIRPPKSTPIFTFFENCFEPSVLRRPQPAFHPVKSRLFARFALKALSRFFTTLPSVFHTATAKLSPKVAISPLFSSLLPVFRPPNSVYSTRRYIRANFKQTLDK